jgi:cytochrome b561
VRRFLMVAALVMFSTTATAESTPVLGSVTKIDSKQGKITLKHRPIKNLEMDAMTMVFAVGDPTMLKTVKVGDKSNSRPIASMAGSPSPRSRKPSELTIGAEPRSAPVMPVMDQPLNYAAGNYTTRLLWHWSVALLVLSLIATSLPFEPFLSLRPAKHAWHQLHLSLGWLVLLVTSGAALRLGLLGSRRSSLLGPRRLAAMLRIGLLALVLLSCLSGVLAFTQPPLLKMKILGQISAPVVKGLDPGTRGLIRALHIWSAYLVGLLLLPHIWDAIRPRNFGRRYIWRMLPAFKSRDA